MQLLLSSHSYPSPHAPLSAFLAVLAEEIVCQGYEVTVLAPQSLTMCWKHKIPICPRRYETIVKTMNCTKKITVLRPYSITFGQGRFYRLSQMVDKMIVGRTAKWMKKKPDVIYCHFWWSAENIVDYAVKERIPLFVATGEHAINIDQYLCSERINYIKQKTRGVICVSEKNREESIVHGLTDGSNTIVLPNAINTDEFHPLEKTAVRKSLGFPLDAFIVAYCGRFSRRKGSNRLSEAISVLGDENIKSLFIGMVSEGENEKPCCPGILFKGTLPHQDIPLYLNTADVFVLPTLAEGCSNAIVEAMACGLPVISSDLSFNHDICTKENSILIDPMNVEAIASNIRLLKNDRELRRRLSEGALRTVQSLTIEKRAKKILQFMEMKCEQ